MEKDEKNDMQEKIISLLYRNAVGRRILRLLISPWFSRLGGWCMNTRLSAFVVPFFVRKNGIDLSQCEKEKFDSFNDFFKRKLLADAREINTGEKNVVSPCDARLSVYPIEEDSRFCVKGTEYTLESLLRNEKLAKRYQGGVCWLYRLCVDDYHRYIYPETGEKSGNHRISGVFHTVNPIAGEYYPIYKENTREYCLLKTRNAGTMLLMEVGAMLVGKIENRQKEAAMVKRGQEKGNFAFGGSTIIVLTQEGRAVPREDLIQNTKAGIETRVKLGEMTGIME